MLFGLVNGAARVIPVRRTHLFHVGAQHMSHRARKHEFFQAVGAGSEGREVGHVETTGVEAVSGQQISGAPVVDGDAGFVVAGNRNNIENAATQVDLTVACGPLSNAGGLLDCRRSCGDELHAARHFFKVRVARGVVAVAVGMNHDQLWYRAAFALGPFRDEAADKFRSINLARAGVLQ